LPSLNFSKAVAQELLVHQFRFRWIQEENHSANRFLSWRY